MSKNLLKKLSLLLFAVIFLAGCALSNSNSGGETAGNTEESQGSDVETQELVAGTGGVPAPYIIVDESGQAAGYDIELFNEVVNRLPQYTARIEVTEIPSVLTGLTTGNYDIGVNNFSYNEERAENYYYSYPYNSANYVFIHHQDSPIASLEDAANQGLTYVGMAATNNTTAVEKYNEENPDNPITIEYSDAEIPVVLQQMESDPSKFRIDDYPIWNLNNEAYQFENLTVSDLSEEDDAYISRTIVAYFLFPKTEEGKALRDEFNVVIKEMAEDGTIKDLTEKHFNRDQTPGPEHYGETVN